MMAIVASGAYYRPFNTKKSERLSLAFVQQHPRIAVPNADGQFNERYAYVLNGDGTLSVGKYDLHDLLSGHAENRLGAVVRRRRRLMDRQPGMRT
jgi:hypothetical protein